MKQILKILLTPAMALLAAIILLLGWFYFDVLVKLYNFAWKGWD